MLELIDLFETVLFPIGHPRQAIDTAKKALDLARAQQSQLILLVVEDPEGTDGNDSTLRKNILETILDRSQQAGIVCEALNRKGKPAFVICDVADEKNVDLIVMGTKGINLEEEKESIAVRVIQLAPCPVLVVP